ncbi:MAG: hypothetical protein E6R03_00200 [Hyphomicrobiaceae bacterium]|nr:MAG: hypothetical protein E6R03_00200 [Hyphomicrobiaceae bacterium]
MMEVQALQNLFVGGAQVQRGERFEYPWDGEALQKDVESGLVQLLADAGVAVEAKPKPPAATGLPKKSELLKLCADHGIEVKNPVGVKSAELVQLLADAGVAVEAQEGE